MAFAKNVHLYAVRVLDCTGSGTSSEVIAGVDWVTGHALAPAIANMSLGGPKDSTENTAVQNSISAGVTYVIALAIHFPTALTPAPFRQPAQSGLLPLVLRHRLTRDLHGRTSGRC